MKTLFLDAGYLIALEAADDQNHQAAFSHWQELIQNPPNIIRGLSKIKSGKG